MINSSKSNLVFKITNNFVFVAFSTLSVLPLVLILSASFTDEAVLADLGYTLFPHEFSMEAYKYIMQSPKQLLNSYMVTIITTVLGTFLSLLCTSMLAYVMARKDFRFYRVISFLVLFTLLFNGGMVPSYILTTRYYHLKDTIFALILPYVIIPWNVFLMKGFFSDIPTSLIEAAKIDGASEATIFFRIIAPVSKPAFATVGLFYAFTYWNDWWLSLLYIEKPDLTSLQFYLYRVMNNIQFLATSIQAGNINIAIADLPSETARMALCVLAAGPMLFVFPFFQKHFVRGLTVGAVKG